MLFSIKISKKEEEALAIAFKFCNFIADDND